MKRNAFSVDLFFQLMLVCPMIFLHTTSLLFGELIFVLGMLIQFFTGIIQVLSGLYGFFFRKNEFYKSYLLLVIFYFIFMGIFVFFGILGDFLRKQFLFSILYMVIIPNIIAVFYLYKTIGFRKIAQKSGIHTNDNSSDLLDDIAFNQS